MKSTTDTNTCNCLCSIGCAKFCGCRRSFLSASTVSELPLRFFNSAVNSPIRFNSLFCYCSSFLLVARVESRSAASFSRAVVARSSDCVRLRRIKPRIFSRSIPEPDNACLGFLGGNTSNKNMTSEEKPFPEVNTLSWQSHGRNLVHVA